jgi:hypothetical protein
MKDKTFGILHSKNDFEDDCSGFYSFEMTKYPGSVDPRDRNVMSQDMIQALARQTCEPVSIEIEIIQA